MTLIRSFISQMASMAHPVSYAFTIGEENWRFEVTPEKRMAETLHLIAIISRIFYCYRPASVGSYPGMVSIEGKSRTNFRILAHTDSLTDIYNRYGFDALAEKMIAKNPNAHFVAALLDIDDFKFINDIYGHVYGDRALKSLADSMKILFSI